MFLKLNSEFRINTKKIDYYHPQISKNREGKEISFKLWVVFDSDDNGCICLNFDTKAKLAKKIDYLDRSIDLQASY